MVQPTKLAMGGFNPFVVLQYAQQINDAATALLQAGVPYLEKADDYLHLIIDGAKAGKSGAEIAVDIINKIRG